MKRILRIVLALLFVVQFVNAQTAPPTNLSGQDLKTWLRLNWYDGKHKTLGYDGSQGARGYMYSYVDNDNGKVTCIYTGYNESKTFNNAGGSTGMANINCEHTVPQSFFGKADPMVSDIHHLFPTHSQPNGTRSNYPFSDINDNVTTTWHIGDDKGYYESSQIPVTNIDAYSESYSNTFEPREIQKGNTARAIFYFFTMYPTQAGSISSVADPNTLYQWHLQDPVDERERERNNRIEQVQGNRNPFIDYPELVAKAWGFTCDANTQVSGLTTSNLNPTSLKLNWTNGNGSNRLVVMREGNPVSLTPSGTYTGVNSDYSLATDQGNGHRIVYNGSSSNVTITGLSATKTYYLQVFEFCASTESYVLANAPTTTATTPDYTCSGTPTVASTVSATGITQTGFTLNWTRGSGDGNLVVLRKATEVTFTPANGSNYTGNNANYTLATALSDGSKLIYNGAGNSIAVTGLEAGTVYYAQVFESCSNGFMYAVTGAPTFTITTAAATTTPPVNNGNLIKIQDFNGTASDGWEVTSGFSKSLDNTGYPEGQRLRSGSSHQVAGITSTLEFAQADVTGRQGVYLELYNSSVSTTTGNGIEASDYLEVYVALNGAAFSSNPDVKITGDQTDNNVRYGMNGTAALTTTAGTPVSKIFVKADGETGDLASDKAPSKIQVSLPDGTTSVKLKLVIKTSGEKEVWNVEDVGLYASTTTAIARQATNSGIILYPNPANGQITISAKQPLRQAQLQLVNTVGQTVYSRTFDSLSGQHIIDVSQVPAGVYLVHMKSDKLQSVQRLLIVK